MQEMVNVRKDYLHVCAFFYGNEATTLGRVRPRWERPVCEMKILEPVFCSSERWERFDAEASVEKSAAHLSSVSFVQMSFAHILESGSKEKRNSHNSHKNAVAGAVISCKVRAKESDRGDQPQN